MKIETIKISDDNKVTLTAYIPDISDEMSNMKVKPAILIFPGGAYKFCSDREAEPVALEFIAKGFNCFILRYSLNENAEFPAPLIDAQNAFKMIKENSVRWHTDPNRIAVCGFSAGGHLAAALCTISDYKPNACILGYPCILESVSPILAKKIPSLDTEVSELTPPTFIFAASDDKTVPIDNSLRYALALGKNNVPFEMHIFSRGGHGFSMGTKVVASSEKTCEYFSDSKRWFKMCIDWINNTL